MKLGRRALLASALAAPAIGHAQDGALETLARRAATYLIPVYEMYRARWQATVNDQNPARQRLNRIVHLPALAIDTLISSAWLDLSVEPMFLTVPDMGERYYSFALLDMFTDTFASVSRRLDGGKPRPRMIVGPRWKGDVEYGLTVVRAPTSGVWLRGRLLVDGEPDLETARLLQSKALFETPDMHNERRIIEMQELMRQRTIAPPEYVADWPAVNKDDPFDLFEVGLRVLGESPLGERDKGAMEEFAPLRLRPGRKFDARSFSAAEREAIKRGIASAQAEVRSLGRPSVSGWTYPPNDSPVSRAFLALTALGAAERADMIELVCEQDAEGQPLDGRQQYILGFGPGQLPPGKAFWSLTPDVRTENPLSRHVIGDRTKGLERKTDGSLEIYVQNERAARGQLSNWLPVPAGPMKLVLRIYEPADNNSWQAPPLKKIS